MAKGLVWAMEELQEQEAAIAAATDMPAAADSLETDMIEVNERSEEVMDVVEAIEEAVEDTDTLEDIAAVMDESTENGGMDQTSARVAEVAIESIYKRLGVRKSTAMPAMESFGTQGTRIGATKIALEGVKEVLKQAWDAIVAAITSIGKWVSEFLAKLFDANVKLKARAEALKKQAEGFTQDPSSKDPKVELGGLASALSYKGKVDAKSVSEGVKGLLNAMATQTFVVAAVVEASTDSAALEAVIASEEGMAKFKVMAVEGSGFTKVGEAKDGVVTLRSEEMLGNQAIAISVPDAKDGKEALQAVSKLSIKVETFDAKAIAPKGDVIAADRGEMNDIIGGVIAISAEIEKSKAAAKKLEEARKKLIADIKKFASTAKETDKTSADRAKMVQKAIAAYGRFTAATPVAYNKVGLSASKAALDFVEKSLKAQKGSKPEAK